MFLPFTWPPFLTGYSGVPVRTRFMARITRVIVLYKPIEFFMNSTQIYDVLLCTWTFVQVTQECEGCLSKHRKLLEVIAAQRA